MKNYKIIIISILILLVILSGYLIYWHVFEKKPVTYIPKGMKINGIFLAEPKSVEDFNLVDHKDRQFSKKNLMNRWTMMFFGFTHCGYVCPVTMTELNKMYKQLKTEYPDNKIPQIVFVTVDPERDTSAIMKNFINKFNPYFIGLRSDLKTLEAFEKQLHITAVKVYEKDQPKDQYGVNHSTEILLFNPKGEIQAYFTFPPKKDRLIKDFKEILTTQVS